MIGAIIGIIVLAVLGNYTMQLLVTLRRYIQETEEYENSSDYTKTRNPSEVKNLF
jgi:hypothetical protein